MQHTYVIPTIPYIVYPSVLKQEWTVSAITEIWMKLAEAMAEV